MFRFLLLGCVVCCDMVFAQDGLKDILDQSVKIGAYIKPGPGGYDKPDSDRGIVDDRSKNGILSKIMEREFNLCQVGFSARWWRNGQGIPQDFQSEVDPFRVVNDQINWGYERGMEIMVPMSFGQNRYMPERFWKNDIPIEVRRKFMTDLITAFLDSNDNKNKIMTLSFVNEVLKDTGEYRDEGIEEADMNWRKLGMEADESGLKNGDQINVSHPKFIGEILQTIKKIAPHIKTELREYNVEYSIIDGKPNKKALAFFQLAKHLKSKKYGLDAVGLQSHFYIGNFEENKKTFEDTIQKFKKEGIEVNISELDLPVSVYGQPVISFTKEKEAQQVKEYESIIKIALRNGVKRISFWGFRDNNDSGWLYDKHPLLFDSNYQKKPAYEAVKKALIDYKESLD